MLRAAIPLNQLAADGEPPICSIGPAFVGFGGSDYANTMTLQSDDKILVAGVMLGGSNVAQFAVARFREDGNPDPSFGDGTGRSTGSFGGSSSSVFDIKITHGGIFVSGQGSAATGNSSLFSLAKLKLDLIFSGNFDR